MVIEGSSASSSSSTSDLAASLPPRKRLLAGLKHNGRLLPHTSSSTPLKLDLTLLHGLKLPDDTPHTPDLVPGKFSGTPLSVISPSLESHSGDIQLEFPEDFTASETLEMAQFPVAVAAKPAAESRPPATPQAEAAEYVTASETLEMANFSAAVAAKPMAEAWPAATPKATPKAEAAEDAAAILVDKEASILPNSSKTQKTKTMMKVRRQAQKGFDLSKTSPPVNDEEFAWQLHRAINSSPRISRSASLCPTGNSMSGAKVPAKVSIKDARKQQAETVMENSEFSENGSKPLEIETHQSTGDFMTSTEIDVTYTMTSVKDLGSFFGEQQGENSSGPLLVEKVDVSGNGSVINSISKEGNFNKGMDINKVRHLASPLKSLESTCETPDLITCKSTVDFPEEKHDFKVTKLEKGQDKLANNEICMGKDLDKVLSSKLSQNTTIWMKDAKVPDADNHVSYEEQDKESGGLAKEAVSMETDVKVHKLVNQAEKQRDAESCKETDPYDVLRLTGTGLGVKRKGIDSLNNRNSRSDIGNGNNYCMNMETEHHRGIRHNNLRIDGSLVKERSLNSRSISVSKSPSGIKHVKVGAQPWPKDAAKGLSSSTESFGGGNIVCFGTGPSVSLRTRGPTRHP